MKFYLVLQFTFSFSLYFICDGLKGTAQLTHYNSYAACCKENPNYDPKASKEECNDYSACKYSGMFKAFNDKKSLSWVKSNNIVAFFDANDPNGKTWNKNYANKKIRLTKGSKTFEATIVDTCADKDCSGCCSKNAKGGYLVDLEYFTAVKNLGSEDAADGTIKFEIF